MPIFVSVISLIQSYFAPKPISYLGPTIFPPKPASPTFPGWGFPMVIAKLFSPGLKVPVTGAPPAINPGQLPCPGIKLLHSSIAPIISGDKSGPNPTVAHTLVSTFIPIEASSGNLTQSSKILGSFSGFRTGRKFIGVPGWPTNQS